MQPYFTPDAQCWDQIKFRDSDAFAVKIKQVFQPLARSERFPEGSWMLVPDAIHLPGIEVSHTFYNYHRPAAGCYYVERQGELPTIITAATFDNFFTPHDAPASYTDKLQAAYRARNLETPSGQPDDIRDAGWAVAVHNDYRLDGVKHTFWLFTKDDRCCKGEGKSDTEALNDVRKQLLLPPRLAPRTDAKSPAAGNAVVLDERTQLQTVLALLQSGTDAQKHEVLDFLTSALRDPK